MRCVCAEECRDPNLALQFFRTKGLGILIYKLKITQSVYSWNEGVDCPALRKIGEGVEFMVPHNSKYHDTCNRQSQ